MGMHGRADDPNEQAAVLEELYLAWKIPPDMRLGQLIYNAVCWDLVETGQTASEHGIASRIFYAEDFKLADTVKRFVAEKYPPKEEVSV